VPPTIRQRLVSYLTRSTSPENPSTSLTAIAKWLNSGNQTVSGEQINEHISLQVTTVQTCIKVLSESVASLPCILYEETGKGRIEAFSNPLHYILKTEPNDEMSSFTFWETMVACNALTGNGYAKIAWTGAKQVGELYPLNPLMTEPYRLPTGKLAYRTRQGMTANGEPVDDKMNTEWHHIDAADILHFRLFSLDGLVGLSPITLARQALGLTRAAEKFGAKFFGNGSKPGGVLTGPSDLDDPQLKEAKQAWEAAQGGSNQGRVAVLGGEWKYTQIGLSPEDSQFLATRVFQRAEIAAMYRVPAHMAGDTSKISNSSYEQMTLSFVSDTLRPILTRIESELNRKLLPQLGRKANKYFVKFDLAERLRSDHATTMAGISVGRQWSLLSVDEGRIALGMNPIGDDTRLAPVNMMNADLIATQTQVPNGGTPGTGEPTVDSPPPPTPKKVTPLDEEEEESEPEPEGGE
jgi:HK97 family phage portal protein